MLKNISPLLSPELLKVLSEMGHGDEIVIADGNFPGESNNNRVIRADGISGTDILKAILSVFPLDTYSEKNAVLMELTPGDKVETPIWGEYESIIKGFEGDNTKIGFCERFEFYNRAKKAYAVVATGESAIYANIILVKGVI